MNSEPRLICLLGAECTGKTTLAQALAKQFDGLWVPEYLRTFTDAQGRTPLQAEQAHIMQEQLHLETDALRLARQRDCAWVFCDTAPLLTAIYSDHLWADASLYPQAHGLHARYTMTLLLEPDIPWVADGAQRDGTAARTAIHARIVRVLAEWPWPYVRIAGTAERRLALACEAITNGCADSRQ